MLFKQLNTGEIQVELPPASSRYSRTNSNQLILCARMNDWEKFQAMWRRKTDETQWQALEHFINELDSTSRWKVKEAFARLATFEDDSAGSSDIVVEKRLP